MKVLYLAPDRNRSDRITGMTFIDEELEALAARGVEAHVLSTTARRREVIRGVNVRPAPSGRGVKTLMSNMTFMVQRAPVNLSLRGAIYPDRFYHAARVERAAANLARREGFDLIHSHFGRPGGFGGLVAARSARLPLVSSFRGMDLLTDRDTAYGQRLNPFYDAAVQQLLKRADLTVYVSDYMMRRGIELGAPAERAIVARKGVRTDLFHPDAADEPADPPEVLVVCNLLLRKRVDHLLRAAAIALRSASFRIAICGTGPEQGRLEQLVRELGLSGWVTFHGWVDRDRMPAMFARASLFVLPSIEEASGNVLLEAQAAGTPAICMQSGGAPEYVRHGETGYVLPANDTEELASRIVELISGPDKRARMGRAARQFAASELTYDAMIDTILAAYGQLTGCVPIAQTVPQFSGQRFA